MGWFDDFQEGASRVAGEVGSWFGGGKKDEGPISVPLTGAAAVELPDSDPASKAYSDAIAEADALRDQKRDEEAKAEGKRSEDWIKQCDEYDRKLQEYENLRTKDDINRTKGATEEMKQKAVYTDQKETKKKELDAAYQKCGRKNYLNFKHTSPLDKYMDPKYLANLAAAEKKENDARLARERRKAEVAASAADKQGGKEAAR